jgi:protein TonB
VPHERFDLRSTVNVGPAEAQPFDVWHCGGRPHPLVRAPDPNQDTAEAREFRGIAVREHDGVRGRSDRGHTAAPSKPVEPKKPALETKTATAVPKDDQAGAGTSAASAGVAGGQAGTGTEPVRLGTGGNLTLVKRVTPIYPTLMQSARMTGQVVLDAVIHPDGTIGDVKVLRSTNEAFAQSAIAAVKQWRYTAPGFEGILTVSVNFTLA